MLTTPAKPFRDVFDYAYQQWAATCPSEPGDAAAVERFLAKARQLFADNRPVALDYLSGELGLRFQDGSTLTFCDNPTALTMGGEPGGVSVSTIHTPRDGKGATVQSVAWGVIGQV